MLGLPKSTEVSMPLFKKDILENFTGSTKQKDLFNKEIQSVRIVNEVSTRSLPVYSSDVISGIFFIEVVLKQQEISENSIEMLFHFIPHNIVLILEAGDKIKLVINNINVYKTDWLEEGYIINIDGLSIDDIWKGFVEQIGGFKVKDGRDLKKQIEIDTRIKELKNQIDKLEKQKNKTKTPSKKHDIHMKMHGLIEELKSLEDSNQ